MTIINRHSLLNSKSAALMLVAAVMFTLSCNRQKHEGKRTEAEPVRGNSVVASVVEYPAISQFPGRLVPRNKALVAPQIMGSLTAVPVDVGDSVMEGQLLFSIDSSTIDAQLRQARSGLSEAQAARSQAQAAVTQARSARDMAELTFNRMKSLLEEKSVSRQQYDQAETGLEMAEAQLEQAQSGLEQVEARIVQAREQIVQAETMKGYTRVTSPLNGVISARMMEPGELAAPGHPVLEVISQERLRLECEIRESLFSTLDEGNPLKVELDAYPEQEYDATVGQLVPRSDPSSHSLTVRFDLEEYDEPLFAGMYGRLLMTRGTEEAVIVPEDALEMRFGEEISGVWVVDNGRVYFRQLELKKVEGIGHVVLNGLDPGERFISPAPEGATDGAPFMGD
jgi:RND family efflux transporter MFP subunit